MVRPLILWRIAAAEKQLGVSVEYLRHILRVSLRAFFKFVKIMPLAEYRRALAPEPYHLSRIVATRDEDCGTCLQIEVNLAKKDGVSSQLIRSALENRPEELPADLAAVVRFTEAVVKASWDEGPLRERLRERYGEEGLVELALAIASCRVFPITKRALGYATSCSRVKIQT